MDEIVVLGTNAERVKQELALRLATDFRPHSHHYRALEDARASATGAASIDVGPLRVCLTFTSWGDGVFPVLAELDRDGALVAVRVQLHTDVSDAVLRALDDLPPRRGA
ncbi:MAG: hypothetical protein KF729_18140 [Sandaracinaceae bacterium]|nr:hypothetical protein [Sandaracinaceae bacterium]